MIDRALLMPDGQMAAGQRGAGADRRPPHAVLSGRSLNNDPTNYWAPNLSGLQAMLRECNFTVNSSYLLGARAIANCVIREDTEQEDFSQPHCARTTVAILVDRQLETPAG